MIDLDDLREALSLGSDTSHDDYLTALEAAAVAHVEGYTGRYFSASGSVTERVWGDGTPYLRLSEKAASLPATVDELSQPGDTPTKITASDSDGYEEWGDDLSILARKSGTWAPGMIYEVSYTRGYASGAEPDDIRQAVTGLVVYWFEKRLPVPEGTNGTVPQHIDTILRRNRRLKVARS